MEGQAMSEHGDKSPTDVLRTKRLEIVDDEGKVCAMLGTNEEGVTSLSVFDQSARLRASLDAGEIPEQGSGLSVFDTNGKPRAVVGMDNDPEQSCFFTLLDADGGHRAVVSFRTDSQAGLRFSSGQKNRAIAMAAGDEGNLYLMLSDEGTLMASLGLTEGEDKGLSSDLALTDKDGRAGAVVSGGRSSDPYVRLMDRRQRVRGSFALGVGGEPRLYVADEEGKPIGRQSAFGHMLADRGIVYQALLFGALLFAGGFGGAWIAGTASASFYSLPAAFITVVVLAALVGWLIMGRRR
jgi:hypothetical protein